MEEKYDVGVIIGRFQEAELHRAHRELIDHVIANHGKVIIILGLAPVPNEANPLDFEARKQMILASYPEVNVAYLKDTSSDEIWSKRLDTIVSDLVTPSQTAVLYGGRDSFISHYMGKLPTRELEQEYSISATAHRKHIGSKSVKAASDFREGVIWYSQAGFPLVISTVDVAIFDPQYQRILLAQKPNETQWRCIGGFTDPLSDSDEADVRREAYEEAQVSLDELTYVGSYKIDDWRYRSGRNKVRTHLFTGVVGAGQVPRAGDDIAYTKWFDRSKLNIEQDVMPEHRKLVQAALDHTIDDALFRLPILD